MRKKLPPVHPGEILREEFLTDYNLTTYALAKKLGVSRNRIERLVREEASVTADTAVRLGAAFNTTAEMWMNLQTQYDLALARQNVDLRMIERV